MFPYTTERAETAVDQVGGTARQMTYFLSSRAMWRQSSCWVGKRSMAKKYQSKPKVTYKMIQEYVEKKYGFKVHTAYIAEVKKALGLTMYDVPNATEELKQPRKHPPKEKAEAIMEALKHFEVI